MGIFSWFNSFKSIEGQIESIFINAVKEAKRSSGGVDIIVGVMIYHSIGQTYSNLKGDYDLLKKSRLSPTEYENMLRKVMNKVGRKYLSNWDALMHQNQAEQEERRIEREMETLMDIY